MPDGLSPCSQVKSSICKPEVVRDDRCLVGIGTNIALRMLMPVKGAGLTRLTIVGQRSFRPEHFGDVHDLPGLTHQSQHLRSSDC